MPLTRSRAVLLTLGAALLATGLRLYHLRSSYDLFVDEVVYRNLTATVLHGGFPRLVDGKLFFFHPPGFFYVAGTWLKVFVHERDLAADIAALRSFNAVCAGITAACLFTLGRRAYSTTAGVVAAALFALDPYAMRQNGRVLLETLAVTWAVLGWVALLAALRSEGRRQWALTVLGGSLFGVSLATKDYSAALTVVPLLVLTARGWSLGLQKSIVVVYLTLLPYAFYLGALGGQGHLELFALEKSTGVRRLLGLVQSTGFNTENAPSLTSTLASQALDFGGTYLMLAVGSVVCLYGLRHRDEGVRIIASIHLGAGLLLGYALAFGTLEEQFLYLLLVPTVLDIGLLAARLRDRIGRQRLLLAGMLGLVLLVDVRTYAVVRHRSDQAYLEVLTFLERTIPAGTHVNVVDDTSLFVMREKFFVGSWPTQAEAYGNNARYVVVPRKEVEQGYAYSNPYSPDSDLLRGAEKVFVAKGPSHYDITVWKLPFRPSP